MNVCKLSGHVRTSSSRLKRYRGNPWPIEAKWPDTRRRNVWTLASPDIASDRTNSIYVWSKPSLSSICIGVAWSSASTYSKSTRCCCGDVPSVTCIDGRVLRLVCLVEYVLLNCYGMSSRSWNVMFPLPVIVVEPGCRMFCMCRLSSLYVSL